MWPWLLELQRCFTGGPSSSAGHRARRISEFSRHARIASASSLCRMRSTAARATALHRPRRAAASRHRAQHSSKCWLGSPSAASSQRGTPVASRSRVRWRERPACCWARTSARSWSVPRCITRACSRDCPIWWRTRRLSSFALLSRRLSRDSSIRRSRASIAAWLRASWCLSWPISSRSSRARSLLASFSWRAASSRLLIDWSCRCSVCSLWSAAPPAASASWIAVRNADCAASVSGFESVE